MRKGQRQVFSFIRLKKKPAAPFRTGEDEEEDEPDLECEYDDDEEDCGNDEEQWEEEDPAAPGVEASADDDRFGLAHAARVFLFTIAVAGVIGASAWAIRVDAWNRLTTSIARHHGQRIDTAQIAFAQPVVKVEGVEELLLSQAYAAARRNPLDRDALAAIRQAMLDSKWMDESTLSVRRDVVTEVVDGRSRRVDRIVIDPGSCGFRRPFALVRKDDTDYLVDGSGTRLPIEYKSGAVRVLPVIVNASGPVPERGDIWRGGDLTDGLLLIRFLRAQKRAWYAQVAAIDVANWDGRFRARPRLMLVTNRGYRIAWGRAVGEEAGIEHPAEEKIRALDGYYLTHGNVIGSPQGVLAVNQPLITRERDVQMLASNDHRVGSARP